MFAHLRFVASSKPAGHFLRTETSHRSQSLWLRTWRLQEVSSCACSIVAQCGVLRVSDTAHSEPGDAQISRAHLCRRRLRCIGFAQQEQAVSRAESALLACAGAARKGGAPPPAPPHRDDARRCASVLLRYQGMQRYPCRFPKGARTSVVSSARLHLHFSSAHLQGRWDFGVPSQSLPTAQNMLRSLTLVLALASTDAFKAPASKCAGH